MGRYSGIRGVVYDLDGTIIDSATVHAAAWRAAADKYDIDITPQFLAFQKGITNEDAARSLLAPLDRVSILDDFVREKASYAAQHAGESSYFEDFAVAYEWLCQKGYPVWVCTSSPKQFCLEVYHSLPQLSQFAQRTIWREMYQSGKAEGLRIAFGKMNVSPKQGVYIGDAPNDWRAAQKAGCLFVSYRNSAIERHGELISLLS